jgi:cytochrome c biogenesis protein CcdA
MFVVAPFYRESPLHRRHRSFLALLFVGILSLLSATVSAAPPGGGAEGVRMFVFWGIGCPHCDNQKPFLRELEERYPALTIQQYEVLRERTHHELFIALSLTHGIEPGSVPTTFLGGKAWVGDSPQIRREIESTLRQEIAALKQQESPEALAPPGLGPADVQAVAPPGGFNVPLLGRVDLGMQPLMVTTLLIAFIDGLNPCSLWVLTLLLGLVIHSGSRGRIALVGITFLTTTALIYGAFIAGVFGVLSYVLYLTWVQWLVALFALTFGLVNIKDYFWFKTGPSFTIADSQKPGIYKGMRGLIDRRLTGLGLVFATVVMAAGIALVELPCTAGFPVVWSGIVAERNVTGIAFLLLLAVYLFVYLLIELVVFTVALLTLRMKRFEEGHGRVLKLVGGTVMVALALVLVLNPDLMNDITGTLVVFMGSILLATAVILLHRRTTAGQSRGDTG